MTTPYHVSGGVGGHRLPGVLGPRELDLRSEWVRVEPPRDLVEALRARLGSEVDPHRVLLAVLCPLRRTLDGPPLDALLARLPAPLKRELGDEIPACGPVRTPSGAGDYLFEVSRLLMQPPPRAASLVRAAFAAARAALSPGDVEAIAARLPPDLAELWRKAR